METLNRVTPKKKTVALTTFLALTCVFLSFGSALAQDILPIQFHEQERWNWCGVAVIQSVLGYHDITGVQNEIAGELGYDTAPDQPRLLISKMGDYFKYEQGFDAYLYHTDDDEKSMNTLRYYVNEGIPVIVLQQKYIGSSEGHYRIVVGFKEDKIAVLDPMNGLLFIPEEDFLSLWQANSDTKYDNQMLVVKERT